ncbi:MAG: hypothetical protein ACO1PM_08225 [Acidovorax sp.]
MHTYAQPLCVGIDMANGPDMTVVSTTGTLAHDAEVRVKPNGAQGDPVHVVCMDLLDVVPNVRAVHVEQPHTDRAKADACAARYRKGMRVTVHCPLQDVRLSLPNALQIEIQPHLFTKP